MSSSGDVVIASAARTAIGKFGGTLASVPATDLGAVAIRAAVERAGIGAYEIDEVLMGNVVSAGMGQAPARQAAIRAGLPADHVSATTISKVCGSGLKTVMLGTAMITAGDAEVIVAGGMENMNLCPYLLKKARTGYRLGHGQLIDACVQDGLWCAFEDHHMGSSAEWIAQDRGLTRQQLDDYAVRSHRRAVTAQDAGKFREEIAPVRVPQRRGPDTVFAEDEGPRRDTSLEALARLRPAFREGGLVTAGNSPGITDGAAALLLMSRSKAEEQGCRPMARVTGYAQAGVEPLRVFTAPTLAVQKLMTQQGCVISDYDLIEANEAFAAQVLANGAALGWDWDKVNVHGGAIALGHPIGCSGARILVTLLYALLDRGLHTGLATLCLGGGEAVALSVEME